MRNLAYCLCKFVSKLLVPTLMIATFLSYIFMCTSCAQTAPGSCVSKFENNETRSEGSAVSVAVNIWFCYTNTFVKRCLPRGIQFNNKRKPNCLFHHQSWRRNKMSRCKIHQGRGNPDHTRPALLGLSWWKCLLGLFWR
jgi:hypothetical protein